MSYQPPPPPPARPRGAIAAGPALTVVGVGVAGTALFGLPLSSDGSFDLTSYSLIHSFAAYRDGRGADRLLNGFGFWWGWAQLTSAAVLLVLTAALLLGAAQRVLGIVVAVLAVAFGVVEVVAYGHTPTYRSIQQYRGTGDSILGNASYGVWVGLIGLVVLVVGALVAAVQARRPAPAAAYPPYPPSAQPYAAPYPPADRMANDPPAKQL